MNRAIVIVMDGCGAGEAPDAAAFGDTDHPSTIRHVWESVGGFRAPNLEACGFLAACGIREPSPLEGEGRVRAPVRPGGTRKDSSASLAPEDPRSGPSLRAGSAPSPCPLPQREGVPGGYGRLQPLSKGGKDSVTGHWEMAGIVLDQAFPTYPRGFPADVIAAVEQVIGRKVLGNKPASGTEIIKKLGAEHVATGKPIVYTSADSVFQIACHESVVPVADLYRLCEQARAILVEPNNVERVIARPFTGTAEGGFTRPGDRKDFPLSPPLNLCDKIGDVFGIGVVPELFAGRGFRPVHRTQNNAEHAVMLWSALESDARFIWANFEDFDMLYGHRNDPSGFAGALEKFDGVLGELLGKLRPEDILMLTADHGNDPTSPSTDHSREYVPIVVIGAGLASKSLGDVPGFSAVGATAAAHLGIDWPVGTALVAAPSPVQ